jgi:hypothetical protein
MNRHPTRTAPAARPAVPYYLLPDQHPAAPDLTDLAVYRQHAAELAARRDTDRILYARWKQRQAVIAENDRRNRTVLLGVGVTIGVGLLTGIGVAGWLIVNALAGVNWVLVIALTLLGLAVLGGVGHRCVTVVQHWH